jgi:hypothetical protein
MNYECGLYLWIKPGFEISFYQFNKSYPDGVGPLEMIITGFDCRP